MKGVISKILFLFILLFSVSFQTSLSQIRAPHPNTHGQEIQLQQNQQRQIIQSLNILPLYFVENRGQTNESVKYQVKMNDVTAYFGSGEIVYQFANARKGVKTEDGELRQEQRTGEVKIKNIRMRFLETNEETEVEGMEETEAKVNYFIGKDPERWIRAARTYNKVIYRELYPGIDLIVYGRGGRIKQEYRVRIGGNVDDIAMRYDGAERLRVNERGQLEIEGSEMMLREDTPLSYQIIDGRRIEVDTKYKVHKNNTVRFKVDRYRKDSELIIDPGLEYSTYLGGSGNDHGYGIAVDGNGNAYITGYTYSTDFPITPGVFDMTHNNNFDVFVTKLNSTGTNLFFSTYLGGSGNEIGEGIVLDGSGNAYVTGNTDSGDFPTTPGAFDATHNNSNDVFIFKLNSTGTSLFYSTYLGGSLNDFPEDIKVDGSGYAYITGKTDSANFPTTPGVFNTIHNGNDDLFVTKLNSTGTGLMYSTYLGGTSDEMSSGIALDGSQNVFVTGETISSDFPTTMGAFDPDHNGSRDVFIAKLNSTATSLYYSTYLGGSGYDHGHRIAVDESGNAYVTGRTSSPSFPTTPGAYDTSHNGNNDSFVIKLDPTGENLIYSTFLGGNDHDYGLGIAIDGSTNVYVTGYTESSDFPTTSLACDADFGGDWEVFISKLNSTGTSLTYSTYLGGSGNESASRIVVDRSGSIYVVGTTNSSDFPVTPGAYDTVLDGAWDVFITKISSSIHLPIFDGHDFTGSSSSDVSVWRPSSGKWYIQGMGSYTWGTQGDIPVNGDYNGDGTTDIAVWRPSNGWWYLRGIGGTSWGTAGDIPVPGNYDGDVNGTTDLAVWRPSNGRWYIKAVGGSIWGTAGDIPVPGDYNGDGTTEIAVWRPSTGRWYIHGVGGSVWGTAGDVPVPGDYNGDGTEEIAVWRPSNGRWYIKGIGGFIWGQAGDIPVPGDFNGDGITDIAVWRPSNGRWYLKGLGGHVWGMEGDIPLVK